ncbi:unnamed protein product [Chilo suppressalis]|uniref:R3H domain-containing protein n=1 Tax=Chilo suppressalis TaxID=168631 RepID=A0ABN8LAL8_CHISP|nr:unnamed protein product [Chilo suppressalis]
MERAEVEKPSSEDGSQLNRNRSFKSKQLVRSQAIRESQSPPRTISPSAIRPALEEPVIKNNVANERVECHSDESEKDNSEDKKQPVEIQITSGTWEGESCDQRQRARRWVGLKHQSEPARDLLSNNPRVSCVCGACANCPHCRGRRRRHICTIKQDSGIACSDDCPDCTDAENSGPDGFRKSESLECDEQIYYCRCPERKEKLKSISLSRTDSDDRLEPTGTELVNFIKETLNKNARDRMTLLKIEKELHALVNDTGRCIVRFPVMTSYGRMLVHRCAALFQLSHHLDHSNKNAVLVSKTGTSGGRIPCTSFKQWCTATFPPSPHRSILKRDTNSLDEPGSGASSNARSKSLEQREREYERMKLRIFTEVCLLDNCPQDENQWPWLNSGPVKLLTPETGRNKLVKVQSLESGASPGGGGAAGGGGGRGAVSKSHSFGGYGGRDPHPHPHHPRLLSRQGDLASSSWRLSPSSSGYKTLSLRSTDSVTPSPTGGASPEPCPLYAVPPGALVINPQTGRPLTNPDGSLYHFDPANPPIIYDASAYHDEKIDQNVEKKRGKLEKQHSFIDNECECQPTDESRNKCCCPCRRNDACRRTEKSATEQSQNPPSPCANLYEHTETQSDTNIYESKEQKQDNIQYETTNTQTYSENYENNYERLEATQRQTYDARTNQRPPYEQPSNQMQDNQQVGKLSHQDSQEFYTPTYGHVKNGEVVSPPAPQHSKHSYPQQEMNIQSLSQNKGTPVPMPDPHIRPVSLTNMAYPTIQQSYPYINQFRVEQSLQPVYPGMVHNAEDHKVNATPPQEPTFRIDPSYPYAAVDFASQCGACVDPNTMRSYSLPYGQVEVPQAVLPTYPVGNVMLPQHIQHYPYQDGVQWQPPPMMPMQPKLVVPELYPVYPNMYQYNLLYPQVIPQPYPICQPMYGVVEKPPSRSNSVTNAHANIHSNTMPNTFASAVHAEYNNSTEARAPSTHNNDSNVTARRNSNEIAAKIQQIKDQMAQLNTRDRDRSKRNDEWKRRNNGNGILGSYPTNNVNGRVDTRLQGSTSNDETQLSSAARAIVNSIRNMQVKTNNYQDRREYQYRPDRADYRRRERDGDRLERDNKPPADRNRNLQLQYRPPYLLRQMSPGTWCRRSPGPVHPVLNHPRRPNPDARNGRR